MEISIFTLIIGIAIVVALIVVLARFAVGLARGIFFTAIGLFGIYVIVMYRQPIMAFILNLFS